MSPNRKTMLYFAPHQDDELLTMGVDIASSVLKHYDVHVILCSDGSKSYVKDLLNNGKNCAKHEGLHTYELSTEEFVQARDREFKGSCEALGVKFYNVHFPEDRAVDGTLTVSLAEKIIRRYLLLYGKYATVCTMAPNNGPAQHRDHKTLGKAVTNLLNKGVVREAKFFIEPYHFAQICDNPRLIPVDPTIQKASSRVAERIKKAIDSYSCWNPEEQRYAVGYHSVTTEFNDFLENMNSYHFMQWNNNSMTPFEKISYQHKKWLKLKKQKQLYYSISDCEKPDLGTVKLVSIQAGETEAYKDFCAKHDMPCPDRIVQRLTDGSSFWCLVSEDDAVLSTGWLAYQQKFYIGETDYGFDMANSKTALLYNFGTQPEHRGKGLYGLLLKAVVHHAEGPDRFVIYTSPDNSSSSRGILKAGFQFDGALSASDHSLPNYLRQAGFTSITRKNQLWGLRVIQP